MKSKLNDASLIAEAYSQISRENPIEEGLGAIAGGIGKLAKRGLKAVGKEAAVVAGEIGKEGLKVAGKAAMGAGKAAIKGLDKAGQAADRGISKLAGDEEKLESIELGGKLYEVGAPDPETGEIIISVVQHSNGYMISTGQFSSPEEFVTKGPDSAIEAGGYALTLDGQHMDEDDLEDGLGHEDGENMPQINHHDDSEMKMALAELYKIEKYAGALSLMMKELPALEGWTASKITKAADYLGSVFHKLDYDFASGEHASMFNAGHEDVSQYDCGAEDGEC